jgi:hypothetical protein
MLYNFLGDRGVNTRYLSVLIIILGMAIILGTLITYIWMDRLLIGGGDDIFTQLVESKFSNLGENTTVRIFNVTQGSTQQVNFTLTSKTDRELFIPLDLKLMVIISETYKGELDSLIPSRDTHNHFHYNQSAQDTLFTYKFSPNQLVLQPYESDSTIISFEIVEDAPSGFYIFDIGPVDFGTHRTFGNWI